MWGVFTCMQCVRWNADLLFAVLCFYEKSEKQKKAMSPLHILAAGNGVLQAVWLHSKCDSVWVFLSSGQPCSGLGASFLEKHMLCACPHNFVDIPLFFFFETLFTCVLGSILERGHWVLRFFFCLFEPIITIVAVCVCVRALTFASLSCLLLLWCLGSAAAMAQCPETCIIHC